jgi:hypothetical protein
VGAEHAEDVGVLTVDEGLDLPARQGHPLIVPSFAGSVEVAGPEGPRARTV